LNNDLTGPEFNVHLANVMFVLYLRSGGKVVRETVRGKAMSPDFELPNR
jgi:hypothetical protein